MDNLKKYLQENKSKMDVDAPRDAVWDKIQQSQTIIPQKKVIKMMWRYAVAACMLALLVITFFWSNKKNTVKPMLTANTINMGNTSPEKKSIVHQQDTLVRAATTEKHAEIATSPKENIVIAKTPKKEQKIIKRQIAIDPAQLLVQDVDRNYGQLVNYQLQRLRATPVYAESPSYFSTFKQQLKQVEEDEITIKRDIKIHGLNDELLQQLININQQKLNVLKDLQVEIGKLNNKVKQLEPRTDSIHSFYLTM